MTRYRAVVIALSGCVMRQGCGLWSTTLGHESCMDLRFAFPGNLEQIVERFWCRWYTSGGRRSSLNHLTSRL